VRRPSGPWIAGGLLLVAAAAGCAMVLPRWLGGAAQEGVPTLRLAPAPFLRKVSALGNLRAARAQTIGVPTGVPGPFQVAWVAPDGARGDIVRVSDGRTTVYLTPAEFDVTGEPEIRAQLAAAVGRT